MDAARRRAILARGGVYLIVGPGDRAAAIVGAALAAGVRIVQLRAKGETDRDALSLARQIAARCGTSGALFIVNDRADLALLADADGVHVGPDDISVAQARRVVGPERIVGASAHGGEEARALVADGADYLGSGAVYRTRSKDDAVVRGLAVIRSARQAIGARIPLYGIGGIDATNAGPVIAAGADGVVVSDAIQSAADPRAAARALVEVVAKAKAEAA